MTKTKSNKSARTKLKTKAIITKGIIKCPFCGTEYHPSEIFMSNSLLGKPKDILKDPLGKIITVEYKDGEEPNVLEDFECDCCGKPFTIEATISYRSKAEATEKDFSDTKTSLL